MRKIWTEEQQRLHQRTVSHLRLQRAIMTVLPQDQPKLDRVAAALGLSARELRALSTNLPRVTDLSERV